MKLICDGKYQLGGPKEDAIGLPVSITGLPNTLEVEGCTLTVRSKFHVTLVATGEIIKKHSVSDPEFTNKVIADFCEYVKTNPVEFVKYTKEYRFAAQNERRSVVAMCEVSNLGQFFELLNSKYNLKLSPPPTHVTLYTLQPDVGIFLTDSGDIALVTKIISPPIKI